MDGADVDSYIERSGACVLLMNRYIVDATEYDKTHARLPFPRGGGGKKKDPGSGLPFFFRIGLVARACLYMVTTFLYMYDNL
jgi:hypothetical protein